MAVEIDDLKSRLETCELNNSRKSVSITGVGLPKSKRDAIYVLEDFFYSILGMSAQVDDFYTMGDTESKITIVSLQTIKQKQAIMQSKKRLKDYKTKTGNKIYINDYLPLSPPGTKISPKPDSPPNRGK